MGPKHTPEEKIEIAKAVCEAYATGEYTIASCAQNQGISERTWFQWNEDIAEISELYKKACRDCDKAQRSELKKIALTSLGKLVMGHEADEVHNEGEPILDKQGNPTGKVRITKTRKIRKYYPPHCTAVIFTLKHLDERFKEDPIPLEAQEQVFRIGDKDIKF
jgi:hypothetical protein